MNEENKNIYLSYWILLITFLVALIIVVGGLTRLTDSGLSITKWDLISGIIPPLNNDDWLYFFSLYKEIPEFKILNYSMTLNEFKVIFWWEYIHRLLGRLIGILFILPLIYFSYKKYINKKEIFHFSIIFILICFQGFLGWYMVKSGLVDRTDVSHYRLSMHLTLAFIIYILLLWNYLKIKNEKLRVFRKIPILSWLFLIFLIIQISIGALVSGLDAGKIYQTWPLMNETYFPDDSNFQDLIFSDFSKNPSLVQFIHRNVAYFIIFLFLIISFFVFKNKELSHLRKITVIIFFMLCVQTVLGILTILSGADILLASMHQIGSIFLVTTTLIFVFKNSNSSS